MSRLIILTIAILTFVPGLSLFSQRHFAEGYIVKADGDTVTGFLYEDTFNGSSRECVFKLSADAPNTIYRPDEVRAYRFNRGKYYVSKKILSDKDSVSVFLEYLVDGVADLYFLRGKNQDRLFIEMPGNII